MNIVSFIHPKRTFLPCSGVGRHINNVLLTIAKREGIDLTLLYSKEFLLNGKLPENAPLRNLPFNIFDLSERLMERSWKAIAWPKVDQYAKKADWLYAPMDSYLPVKRLKTAITIHDIQAFEDDLPWSKTKEHQYFRRRWGLWLPKALLSANIVFTVSEFSRKRIIETFNLPKEKVKVSGNAVDPGFKTLVEEVGTIPNDFPYVVVLGGLRPKKGGQEIIKLSRQLLKVWPELQFVVWGEHDPELLLEAKNSSNIQTMGMISDMEMVSWIKGAHASLFLSWYEGFGLPVLESMACGIPVICSNKASLPEVAGNAALMASPDQTDLLMDYIIQLRSGTFRSDLVGKGLKQAKEYSWEVVTDSVVNSLASHKSVNTKK